MATYHSSELKNGIKIVVDNEPYLMLSNEFVKPGKGQAFTRVKIRNLKTGRVIDRTYKSGESVEAADVLECNMQYLYQDNDAWYFMDQGNYEQYPVNKAVMQEAGKWLKGEEVCVVTLWNDTPLTVSPPNFVILRITETDPGVRGNTATNALKPATTETGAIVKVPLFVEAGELIKIDTRVGGYVSRVQE